MNAHTEVHMQHWSRSTLGEVATIERRTVDAAEISDGTTYVGLENIETGGNFVNVGTVENGELSSNKFVFTKDHILYGKLRPYLAKIARPDFDGICSTDILPILPRSDINRDYLTHFLRLPVMVQLANSRATGANLPRVSPKELASFKIPVPPLLEQSRIATLLDKTELLRAKRSEAIAQLDELAHSIFLDMFGDPTTNSMGWRRTTLAEVLSMPLRNGVSPSRGGKFQAKVLTLSAITGDEFKESALKWGDFETAPPSTQTVDDSDLLICRGNGNIDRVGKAYFPAVKLPNVLFPDTVIAARTSASQVSPIFMEAVWKSKDVRRQIEAVARTTNGTFKVNQKALEGISFFLPPLPIQQDFAKRVQAIDRVKESHRSHLAELDALFGSLQYRAFRGEL